MIVRILGEGQLELDDSHLEELNALDAAVEKAVSGGDEDAFREALAALVAGVRSAGTPLPDEEITDSDLILPPPDATLDEVREMLSDDGLIPG